MGCTPGKGVIFSNEAKNKLQEIKAMRLDGFPVIVAKTQYSLSSNEKLLGAQPAAEGMTIDANQKISGLFKNLSNFDNLKIV